MTGTLRFIGIVNAAIWFGGGIFFAAGILPGIFSADMRGLLPAASYSYYSGGIALVLFHRFFMLQYFCGAVALMHLLAEKLYAGRPFSRWGTILVVALLLCGVAGGLWLQPHMEALRHDMYFSATPAEKENARHAFGLWHGFSEAINLVIIGGLLAHLLRVCRPGGIYRYGVYQQFS